MILEADLRLLYDSAAGVTLLELPYQDHGTSMVIVLPDEGNTDENLALTVGQMDMRRLRETEPQTTLVMMPR